MIFFCHKTVGQLTFYIHDHLGNTRLTYNPTPSCSTNTVTYTLESVLDYYPYGKTLRSYTPTTPPERYQSTHNERDPETNYDHREARNSDSGWGRFLGVDALAGEYAAFSPYCYVMGNPINMMDINGKGVEIVTDENGNVTIKGTIYIYGDASNVDIAAELQRQINQHWTTNYWKVDDNSKTNYTITSQITVQSITAEQAIEWSATNQDASVNFFAVYYGENDGSQVEGNYGVINLSENTRKNNTTAAHEFGHILGYEATNGRGSLNKHGEETTHRYFEDGPPKGISTPMMGRSTALGIPSEYSKTRTVTSSDIDGIKGIMDVLGYKNIQKKAGNIGSNNQLITRAKVFTTQDQITNFIKRGSH